jgi:hypothetical protein
MPNAKSNGATRDGATRTQLFRFSSVSLLALSALTSSAIVCLTTTAARASDPSTRIPRSGNCSALGQGFVAMQGVDGCLRVGGHVRVEAQVMRGAASLGAGLPGATAYSGDGPAPAGMRTESAGSTTRMHVRSLPGGDPFRR